MVRFIKRKDELTDIPGARYVMFVRHGKAEDIGAPSYDDFNRRLTDKGMQQLVKFFPKLTARMKEKFPDETWRVYSSPRVRALATAVCLQDALSKTGRLEHPAAKNGSLPAKSVAEDVRVMRELDDSDLDNLLTAILEETEGSICLVGHQPYLSQWTYELTKKEIGFAKGDAVLLRLDPDRPRKAKVVWTAEIKRYLRNGAKE